MIEQENSILIDKSHIMERKINHLKKAIDRYREISDLSYSVINNPVNDTESFINDNSSNIVC